MFGGGKTDPKRMSVHRIAAHSYMVALLFLLLGVFCDLLWKPIIFDETLTAPLGMLFLGSGTILILWAQHASHHFIKENITPDSFGRGPYHFTRNPTHWGLYFLLFGFSMATNAFFVTAFTLVSFFVTKLVFLSQEENLLASKYGDPYLEYKRSVKF
jgi:protein-S-isoprenylcysteine O-methyltransferase Ste14